MPATETLLNPVFPVIPGVNFGRLLKPVSDKDKTIRMCIDWADGTGRCDVTIHNEDGMRLDAGMFAFVFQRIILWHGPQAISIDVYPSERKPWDAKSDPGWLEWLNRVTYRGGGAMTVGTIQRLPGADYESHS